jgi:hypothetical protein
MNYKIEDFVGIFDDAATTEYCTQVIDYFESMRKHDLVIDSALYTDDKPSTRKDETVFMFHPETFNLYPTHWALRGFTEVFWSCYKQYTTEYNILHSAAKHGILGLRVQKTLPGGGYHEWHFENGHLDNASRMITMMLFLNDVDEGGETEFLYQHKRIAAKAGRLVIWPAGYTHTHRGNPPLNGTKYIVTGWLNLLE